MVDRKKYKELYNQINELTPEDTLQIVIESDEQDEKDFYALIGDYLLRKKQKIAIERNLF